jgi:hypothetical protein
MWNLFAPGLVYKYASQLDIEIEDAEMDICMSDDTRGKLLLADVSPAYRDLTYVFKIKSRRHRQRSKNCSR